MERLENEKEPGGPYDFLTKNPEYIRALSEVFTRFDLASLSGLACVKLCFTFIYRISPRIKKLSYSKEIINLFVIFATFATQIGVAYK